MSALSTRPTRGEVAATTSTACLTTAITSSHSPSMLVNMAFVSHGSPEARITRTASATAALTPPVVVGSGRADADGNDHASTLARPGGGLGHRFRIGRCCQPWERPPTTVGPDVAAFAESCPRPVVPL